MCGVIGVSDQNRFSIMPCCVFDPSKIDPRRFIGNERISTQLRRVETLAILHAFLFGGAIETSISPGFFIRLNNEGAHVFIERIGMHLKQSVLIFANNKKE